MSPTNTAAGGPPGAVEMTPPSPPAAAVLAACPGGPADGAYARRLAPVLAAGGPLAVWVTDLLLGEAPAAADGVWLFAAWAPADARPWAVVVAEAGPGRWSPPPVLTLTGGRVVGLTGYGRSFDLVEGRPCGPPDGWFETRVFNLRTLTRACEARMSPCPTPPAPSGPTPTPPPSV